LALALASEMGFEQVLDCDREKVKRVLGETLEQSIRV
jgi:hypothetical protein